MDSPTAGLPAGDGGPTVKGSPTAFVVDDNEMLRGLLTRILDAEGFVVTQARSVQEALALDPAGHDVLLVDIRLGNGSGTDIIEAARLIDPTVTDRCLVLTGAPELDPLPTDVRVLVKPFTADILLDAVRSLPPRPGATAGPDRRGGGPGERT